MKKLLHERLREVEVFDDIRLNATYLSVQENVAHELADEIEENYVARPRYEDGEPVQFKKEFVDHNGHNQTLSSLTYTKGSHDYVSLNGWTKQRLDEPVKRPEPKVLDADGAEIKVGDTVWKTYPSVLKSKTVSKVGCSARREGHAGHEDAPFVDFVEGGWDYARSVTKRESDSLEKLRDDIYEEMCNHEDRMSGVLRNWQCRLTALMERGA